MLIVYSSNTSNELAVVYTGWSKNGYPVLFWRWLCGVWTNFRFTRDEFLLVTMKEWLKSVLNYGSYNKSKAGYPFLDHPLGA